jgi:hypothetical protein
MRTRSTVNGNTTPHEQAFLGSTTLLVRIFKIRYQAVHLNHARKTDLSLSLLQIRPSSHCMST